MDLAFVNRMAGITRGGGEMWDLRMAEKLEDRGANVTFYIGEPIRSELPEPIEEFESVPITTPHLRDLAYAAPIGVGGVLADIDSYIFNKRVVNNLQDADHDVVHINSDPRFGHFISQVDAPVTIKMNGPPHSLFHDFIHPWSNSYEFFPKFDRVIATGVTVSDIESQVDVTVDPIHPGVDTDHFSPEGETSDWDRPTVLFVGRFVPAKDLPELLRGFKSVHEGLPESQLVLVGDGPLKSRLEKLSDSLGLNNAISFPGYIQPEELPAYYRGADVFAVSSKHESFGMVLLEAMACGVPVVAPDIDYIPQIIDDQCGLLYNKGDETDLSKSLLRFLESSEIASNFGEYGRNHAVNHYTWTQQSDKLYQVFRKVIADG